jgi:hypothetical protein
MIPLYTGVDADGVAKTETDHSAIVQSAGRSWICETSGKCWRMSTTPK